MSYLTDNGTFTFDGVTSSTYDVWISGGGTFGAPAKRYTDVVVPGRNGTLTLYDNSYADVKHTYPAFITGSFSSNIESIRNALASRVGYKRLTDTFHTDEFYLAKFMDALTVSPTPKATGGSFDIVFMRDPRRFLLTGETATTFTADGTISNPTQYESRPLIEVTGYGTLKIGANTITIANTYSSVTIDCEIMDCYYGTVNANSAVTFASNDFPTLVPGSNAVDIDSNMTKVKITPRWYRL